MAGSGSSKMYSFLLFTVILSLQEMYRGKLASTELFTILRGFHQFPLVSCASHFHWQLPGVMWREDWLGCWTCKENQDRDFADCSIPQEKSNAEINAELEISDASGDEDASGTQLHYGTLECCRPSVSQQNVASIKTNQSP